ncbi:TPM domain-containing protein [Paenibacillus bovis]|uniref:TPM domain-containing protein n=1 Tax=Paenibacillus bovis TaxID=1616788 RepID=A0A172ZC45_9BACL|nr:TPM domain-containing protein [Paenibacillus bovis]ANF94740.1 hypothetical protein AR543_00960 [Paenibacillus bovis]
MRNNKLPTIRYMPVILLLLLAVYICLYPESAQAAKQQGHIMDHAGLFAEEDISRMNARLDHHTYDLYVITGTAMSQSEGMKLANDIYEQTGFSGNQLLLMITTDPNYVHLVFDNEELSKRIARSNAGSIAGVTDSQFVPYAKKGDLAGGVIAVSDYLNGLGDISSPDTSQAVPATGQLSLLDQMRAFLPQVILYLLGGGVVIALLVLLIIRAVASEKLHRRQARLRARVEEWKERLDSLICAKSRDQGTSASFILPAPEQEIQKCSIQLDRLRQCIESRNISLFSTARPAKELQGLEQQLNTQVARIEQWLQIAGIAAPATELAKNDEPDTTGRNGAAMLSDLSGLSSEQQSQQRNTEYNDRERSRDILMQAPQQLEQLQLLPERYEQELELLREQYARVHIQEQRDRYIRMQELRLRVEQLLPEMAEALDERNRQYDHADALGREVRTALEQIQQQRNAILGYRDELDLHKKLLIENWETMSARHREGVQLLTGIPEEALAAQQSQNESFHMLEQVRRRLINPRSICRRWKKR